MYQRNWKLVIVRVKYLVDEIADGGIPDSAYNNAETEEHFGLSAKETADMIEGEGLTFASTGTDWAALADGSYASNYYTGEETEVSAHFYNYPDRLVSAIMRKVG